MSKKLFTDEEVKLKNMITYLCKVAEVSRSGYYAYFSIKSKDRIEKSNITDMILRDNVLKAFNFKNKKKGSRQVKMVLQNEFNINYNLKRIRRIMKKFDISYPIRNANAYRRMMKATKEHTFMPNILNREFKQGVHYTSPHFQKEVKKLGLGPSMSRRGNC